jgi:hypothetical protein
MRTALPVRPDHDHDHSTESLMTRRHTTPLRRLGALLATLALAATGVAVAAAPAQADIPVLGSVFLDPTTNPGNQDTFIQMDTSAACPSGTEAVKARITGPVISDDGNNNLVGNTEYDVLATNSAGGKHLVAAATLKAIFTNYGLPQTGNYDILVRCQTTDGSEIFGEFVGTIAVVAGTGLNLTFSQSSEATETTTTLSISPDNPVATGTQATLTATIAPSTATGLVQFKRNGVNFGSLVQVVDGTASFTGAIPPGDSQMTAEFAPGDTNAYQPSTSAAVSYLVVPAPVLTGTPQVGQKLTCNSGAAAGTNAFAWLLNGAVVSGQTKATVQAPAGWAGKKVACRVTTTRSGHSVAQNSGQLTIKAAPIKSTKAPVVSGTPKVGKTLRCSAGSWSVKPTKLTYQWLRNGKVIKGATKPAYKLTKSDRKGKVACRVTAIAGTSKAVATSKTRTVA